MEDMTDAQQRWMPESILVRTEEGREPIDIAPCLIDERDPFALLKAKQKRVEFPADVYHPSWESRKDVEQAVKNAVSEADNINLIRIETNPNKKFPCTVLACDMARSYRAPKNANDIQANVYENREDLPRLDNKKRAHRPDGQSRPRRTYTEKPPPEERCPFRIRLQLDPGKCWFLSRWSGCRCHKFHTKLPPGEKRRRMDTCTAKERSDAAIYAQQGSAGVAAGIVREQTGNHFSQSQLRHNKVITEIQTGQVPQPDPGDLEGRGSSADQSQVLQAIAVESTDLYSSCRSWYTIMCDKARHSKNPTVESIIRQGMAATLRKVNEELLSMEGGQQDSSE
jgi:hypothetical protein